MVVRTPPWAATAVAAAASIGAMQPPRNLVLVGPMGAGKSSIGRRLAARFGLRFVDLDEEIEHHTGASVATIFACEGEAGFRTREHAALAACLEQSGQLVATGGGTVLDGRNRALMREQGFVVHLRVALPAQLRRLAHDRSRPLLDCEDREAVLRKLATEREPLYREAAHLGFDTGEDAAGTAAARLAEVLRARWQGEASNGDAVQAHRA